MVNHRAVFTACGAVLLGVLMMVGVKAWGGPEHTTYLTFNTPFALPGVALSPGTYVFELADSNSNSGLVRVMSRDRTHVYLQAFTIATERPRGLQSDRAVVFGEVPKGVTPPIRAWYPIGASIGHEFIYAKNSRQLTGSLGN